MVVWLVTVGEPLPFDAEAGRLLRAGTLANMLAAHGHEVVWWTSSFDHVHKRHRFDQDTAKRLDNGVTIRLLHGPGYRKNVSLRRMADHALVARRFARLAPREPRPDVVLCSLPTLELSVAAVRYGRTHRVPVVLDIRDLWPDVFLDLVPGWLRGALNLALLPMWMQARTACRGAYALTGNSPRFVEWGLNLARRAATEHDRFFPFGYVADPPSAEERKRALSFWGKFGIDETQPGPIACFFGAFSGQFDFETVIRAALLLEAQGVDVRFVLCGAGELLESVRRRAGTTRALIFPGWIGQAEIWTLMRMCTFGLAPYRNEAGFIGNFPNKPIEYLSAGLPVISSLRGYLEAFLAEEHCGITYPAGDAEALGSAVSTLLNDRARIESMSANAIRVFMSHFEAHRVYGAMIDYLSRISNAFQAQEPAGGIASGRLHVDTRRGKL